MAAETPLYDPTPPKMTYLFGKEFFEDKDLEKRKQEEAFAAYLQYLADGNTKVYSYRRAGLTYKAVEWRRANNSEFAALEQRAYEEGGECLVQEAIRRAVSGVEEDVYYKGEVVGRKTNYSDNLLMGLLKARNPEFRETRNVVTADINSTVSPGVPKFDATKYTEDELIALEELLQKGAGA